MPLKIDIWYDRYSAKTLHEFVEDRTGDKWKRMDKLCYVRQLVELDQNWAFRFLDAPPEIRNLIYGNLLKLRDSSSRSDLLVSTPAIIGASKQIQCEAQDLLYSENTFEIHVRSTANPIGMIPANSTKVSFAKLAIDQVELYDASLSDIDETWPTLVCKTESIKLIIELRQPEDDKVEDMNSSSFQQANQVLHSFGSARSNVVALKRLQIVVKGDVADMAEDLLESIVYPLTRLRLSRTVQITIDGLPNSIATGLRRSLQSGTPMDHAVLFEELRAERMKANRLYVQATDAGLTGKIVDQLAKHVREANKSLKAGGMYLDAAYYSRCEANLAAVKECLGSPAVDAVRKSLAEYERIEANL